MGCSFLEMGFPDRILSPFKRVADGLSLDFFEDQQRRMANDASKHGAHDRSRKNSISAMDPLIRYRMVYFTRDRRKGEEIAKGSLRVISNRLQGLFVNNAGKDPAYETDQDGAEESSPEATYMEPPDQAGHQPEHQRIDDQQKEAQSDEG
jgi:hypothetical protein